MPIRPRTAHRAPQGGLLRHWTLWVWFAAALVLCVGGVSLWKSGHWLIHEDKFEKARWGVVLAGESRDCERSDAAIRMFHEGKLDTLVISSMRVFKTRYSSEFMVDYYVQEGVPRNRVFEFHQEAYSTLEEARLLVRQFRLQNLDTVVIITSTYHTARTRRTFRKVAAGYPVVLVAAAEYNVFDPSAFWSNRESLKIWFDEWIRTLFSMFELAKANPETGKADYQGLTPDIWSSHAPAEIPVPDTSPTVDSAADSAEEKSDSSAVGGGSLNPQGDSSGLDAKSEAKASLDSAVARADSLKARKDSVKAHKDSIKAKAAEETVAKPGARETEAKKSLPRAPKKSAAPAAKTAPKASDKKPEKTKTKK